MRKKSEKIYDAMTDIRDDIIEQAAKRPNRVWSKKQLKIAAAIFAVVLAAGIAFRLYGSSETVTAFTAAKAEYPQAIPYPKENTQDSSDEAHMQAYDAWWEDNKAKRQLSGYADTLEPFFKTSTKQFLANAGDENRAYSPLNVYMALGMLAEITDGESRQQILNLLGSQDIQTLRSQASDLWNANYYNDGIVASILASSLWLHQDINYVQSTLDLLAKNYYASSFQGKMGSQELNQLLQKWLNDQTGGLLHEQSRQARLDPDTVMALATTIYFRAQWRNEFLESQTAEDIFYTASGEITCDFMHKKNSNEVYFQGKQFSAIGQSLEGSGAMWFLLPAEGISANDLLNDSEAIDFLVSPNRQQWKKQTNAIVNIAVPKFDISSQINLQEGLQALGVTDVFDFTVSDFSPMVSDQDGLYLSKASHAARVCIDEEGVTAAAYTVLGVDDAGAVMPEKEIDFVLNRPFLFAVTGYDGLPLFVGVVNHPQ